MAEFRMRAADTLAANDKIGRTEDVLLDEIERSG
jgi:hypothetical protein